MIVWKMLSNVHSKVTKQNIYFLSLSVHSLGGDTSHEPPRLYTVHAWAYGFFPPSLFPPQPLHHTGSCSPMQCGTLPHLGLPVGSLVVVCCTGTLPVLRATPYCCGALLYSLGQGHAAEAGGVRENPKTLAAAAAGTIGAAMAG